MIKAKTKNAMDVMNLPKPGSTPLAQMTSKLINLATKDLSFKTAIVGSTSISAGFVLILYIFDKYKLSKQQREFLNNDDISRIKSRTLAAVTATVVSLSATSKLLGLNLFDQNDRLLYLKIIGLRPEFKNQMKSCFHSLALIGTLFLGPLLQICLGNSSEGEGASPFDHYFENSLWVSFKNLVIAPITEETVYRACLVPLLYKFFSAKQLIYITPIFFGTAHIHHLYHKIIVEKKPWMVSLLITLFQFTYTTIFGSISTFLYLKTASLPAVALIHSFCNLVSFPDFAGVAMEKNRLKKAILCVGYAGGLIGFFYACRNMIDSDSYFKGFRSDFYLIFKFIQKEPQIFHTASQI